MPSPRPVAGPAPLQARSKALDGVDWAAKDPCEPIRQVSLACSVQYQERKHAKCKEEFEVYKMCLREARKRAVWRK